MEATLISDSKNIPCSKEKQVLEQNNVKPHKHLGWIRSHIVQFSWSKYGHLQLNQDARSPLKPEFECFQGWDIHPVWTTCSSISTLSFWKISSLYLVWIYPLQLKTIVPLSYCLSHPPTTQFFPSPSPLINVDEPVLFLYPRVSLPLFHIVSILIMWC